MSQRTSLGGFKDRLRARAAELGLGRIGFSAAGRSPRADAFHRWLAQGFAGEMSYLEHRPDSRSDVTIRSPWARTIVSAALAYEPAPDLEAARDRPGVLGHVSAYAHGPDYHSVLKARLEELARFVREDTLGRAETRCLVDTSAILERDHAAVAGIGWTGKNAMTIDPESGSYFFLGEILTDLELDPGPEIEDQCGGCTRCIEACPTQAIVGPRVVDARKCISYLTIELKGAIPSPLRPALGAHLFGCDVCQQVCPWNGMAAKAASAPLMKRRPGSGRSVPEAICAGSGDPEVSTRHSLESTTLAELVTMDDATFAARFRGSALARAKRRGIVRNAVIVAANTEDEEALRAARPLLEHEDPILREAAAWALTAEGRDRP